jgi:serine protease
MFKRFFCKLYYGLIILQYIPNVYTQNISNVTALNNVKVRYILTPKRDGIMMSSDVAKKIKVRSKSKVHNKEFIFLSDVSESDLKKLSENYIVEKDGVVNMNVEWHLDRIDQRAPLNKPYTYKSGNNVDIYIFDTGVDFNHPEFSNLNRVRAPNYIGDGISGDCNGHGTHVASLAVGQTCGVANGANLIDVKVLGCSGSGTYSGIINAISWVTQRAKTSGRHSIINMSLGGGLNTALHTAMKSSFDQGVYYVVAAGNGNDDACKYSPAGEASAITVAASTINEQRAGFSNYGSCVDVFAPGLSINGARSGGGFRLASGTSMASPVAAGVLALYVSKMGRMGFSRFRTMFSNTKLENNMPNTPNKLVYFV